MSRNTTLGVQVHGRPSERHSRRLARLGTLGLSLMIAVLLQGCVAAATFATVKLMSRTGGHEATVELDASATEVYAAVIRILERQPDIKVSKRDDERMLLTGARGQDTMSGQVRGLAGKRAELTVRGVAGERSGTDEQLALSIVQAVCAELGIKWKVVRGELGDKSRE